MADVAIERLKKEEEKVNLLLGALEGKALREIQRHSKDDRDAAEKILNLLDAKYADRRTATQIRRQFYETVQKPGQSINNFSDALLECVEGANERLGVDHESLDSMMRDQFAENVLDQMLRWELRKVATTDDDATFDDLREIALNWESGMTTPTTAGATASGKSRSAAVVEETKANEELNLLREMVIGQQKQIESLKNGQKDLMNAIKEKNNNEHSYSREYSRDQSRDQGRGSSPVCYYCGRYGHIQFYCRKRMDDQRRKPSDNSMPKPAPRASAPPQQQHQQK